MSSPICEILNPTTLARTSLTDGYDTLPSTLITIVLRDTTGVKSWDLTCIGTDDQIDADTVTAGISINNTTKRATFTTNAATRGSAYIFQSVVNGGVDTAGTVKQEYTSTFGIFAIGNGRIRLLAKSQTTEGDAEFGWTVDLNNLIDIWNDHETTAGVTAADITTTGICEVDKLIVTENITLAGALHYTGSVFTTINDAAPTYELAWNENVSIYECDGYTTSGDRTFVLPTIPYNTPISCFTIINNSAQGLIVNDYQGLITTIDGYESYDWYAENEDYNSLEFIVSPFDLLREQEIRIGIGSTTTDYQIDWGDGNITTATAPALYYEHTYATPSVYKMIITFVTQTDLTSLVLDRHTRYHSYLIGKFPSFKFFTNLTILSATGNKFSGVLPSFSYCTNLHTFNINSIYSSGNLFSGTLPSFNSLTGLVNFDIGGNNFSGTLPSFAACTNLANFNVNGSNFTGTLPSFATCTSLSNFSCRSNFTGDMPSFATLTNLASFQCTGNFISFPDDIPTSAYYVKIGNIFTGTMPTIHTNLSQIYITGNYSGDMPDYDAHLIEITNSQHLNPPTSFIHTNNQLRVLHISAYLTSMEVDDLLVYLLGAISSIPNLNAVRLQGTNDAPSSVGIAAAAALGTYGVGVWHN